MMTEIGVFNVPPVYVLGLTALSTADGYRFEAVAEPCDWIRRHQDAAMLVGVGSRSDLDKVTELKSDGSNTVIVTLIDDYAIDRVLDSLEAGASGAVSRDAAAGEIVLALNAALIESTLIPTEFVRRLAADGRRQRPACLENVELGWLQSLAESETVANLGRSEGYSEREMYRRLKGIYRKMGVRSRTEALLKASRFGWIH